MQLSYISRSGIIILTIVLFSCKKQKATKPDFAVLQLYGWIASNGIVVTNYSGAPLANYSEAARVNSLLLSLYMNKYYITDKVQPFAFFAYPDTLPKSAPLLKLDLQLEKHQIYSLFMSGTTASLDTVLVKDNFPVFQPSDSAAAVRFVNLMRGDAVSINLKGKPYGSVVQSLPYMGVTEFQNFPVRDDIDTYEFEVRDAVTNNLLTTYSCRDVNAKETGTHRWLAKLRTHAVTGIRGNTSAGDPNSMTIRELLHN
jgi:hypothetical protein